MFAGARTANGLVLTEPTLPTQARSRLQTLAKDPDGLPP